MLLKLYALRNDVALHGFLFEAAELFESLGNGLLFLFFKESLTSLSYSVHKLRLEKIVKRVKLKALVK